MKNNFSKFFAIYLFHSINNYPQIFTKMKRRPRLSFWQIWNMNFGFLGIQFGYALQNANVSRIFETLGASVENIPILWIAAPLTGLIVQPIIGHLSDKTWGRLGRRRPYFLIGAILASLALIIMPNSPVLWVAAGMLWIMDASINISQEPFRAFVGDLLPSEQRTKGFSMQSFFIGAGAVIASALPYIMTNWLGISNTAPEGVIPPSVKYSFYIGAAAFFLTVLWTVIKTKEYSPEQLKEFNQAESKDKGTSIKQAPSETASKKYLINRNNKFGIIFLVTGIITTYIVYSQKYPWELYVLTGILGVFGILELIVSVLQNSGKKQGGLVEVINDFNEMPKTMVQLAFVQFFSWFALFALWIYTTAGVTSHVYDMDISKNTVNELQNTVEQISEKEEQEYENLDAVTKELGNFQKELEDENKKKIAASMEVIKFFADSEKTESINLKKGTRDRIQTIQEEYNTGANWVGICFAIYNGFAAIFAFLLIYLAKLTNRKITHIISLTVGGISLISIYFIGNPTVLIIPFIGIGLTWASILAMPYAMLTGSLPQSKMGVYMGIFNFFIVLPQILAASILGFIVKYLFDGMAIHALTLGGVTWFLAAFLVLFVKDRD